ncbi:YdaS family helix-turn-helix protein [Pseudomonas marincola]|uniref:transcriptional regulator n=1 Tax=Pseudomonas marincola TaxID=437900 RepID=UPI0012404E56
MDFSSYYKKLPRGGKKRLASILNIELSYLSRLASGNRGITAERAIQIESATDGEITRHELRPDFPWREPERSAA